MLSPQQERQKRLAEMAPVVRVFAALFVSFALLQFFSFENIYPTIFIQLTAILFVLYLSTFGLEQLRQKFAGDGSSQPIHLDFMALLGSLVLLGTVLFMTGGVHSSYKIIFLPTVLFYTVRFGLRWGLASSGLASFILAAANLYSGLTGDALNLELDFIYSGVFFLTAWLVGTMVDMERSISDRLSRQVIVDDLTGLYNHRHLQEELNRRIAAKPREPFALILADLDYFRYYNETHGHIAGDQLLVKVAESITQTVGDAGTVFRYGSDEFAVIAEDAGRRAALKLAERIRGSIKDRFTGTSSEPFWKFNLTASLGLAVYPEDGSTREVLLKKAEEALYKAKVISGNKVEAYFSILEQVKAGVDGAEKEVLERLKTFLAIINAKDRYTYGHSERVLIYSSIIAFLLKLPFQERKILQYGSYLHDIGKIDIDRAILSNAGHLTGDEWKIIRSHPLWGAEIIKQVKLLDPAVPVILYHHERYDGKGYPFGLTGVSIPVLARIMSLADAFDAMTVERPYKPAKTYFEAICELEQNKGRHFDPELVNLFVGYLKQHSSVQEILDLGTGELIWTGVIQ